MTGVIIVPETEGFEHSVSHANEVLISKKLGTPKLKSHDAKYLAPFWIKENEGVNRIYHIVKVTETNSCTVIHLGNSFVTLKEWTDIGQRRKFEYKKLSDFGFVEVCPGVIVPNS